MERRQFMKTCATSALAFSAIGISGDPLAALSDLQELPASDRLPALFIGHGSPMNAIEDNSFTRSWKQLAQRLPTPKAILCISAHWLTRGKTKVTTMQKPRTIYDFGGFPKKLYEAKYPAPGAPKTAAETIELVKKTHVFADEQWGLDHGTWSVLLPMFPNADIPVFQLSIDFSREPQYHFELARELRALRDRGVLIVGSGNLVHNLSRMRQGAEPYDWAVEFEATMLKAIEEGDSKKVIEFQELGEVAHNAHPSIDHFLPILYTIAQRQQGESIHTFNRAFDLGSISMVSFEVR